MNSFLGEIVTRSDITFDWQRSPIGFETGLNEDQEYLSDFCSPGRKNGSIAASPTSTPTSTLTSSPTSTPTVTSSPTSTLTSTFTPTPTVTPITGDFDQDRDVDPEDLITLIAGMLDEATGVDLNQDGNLDQSDIFLFSVYWGVGGEDTH